MTHELTAPLWGSMLWFRERRLGNGLRLDDQNHLDTLLESRPYLTMLYANYPDLRIDQIQSLWLTAKSWHLKQIGFYLKDVPGMSSSKFDVRAVWSNLNKRAAVLIQQPLPTQSAVRYGQLLVTGHGDNYDYWLLSERQQQ